MGLAGFSAHKNLEQPRFRAGDADRRVPDLAPLSERLKVVAAIASVGSPHAALGLDAGVRLGETIAQDMIAPRIGPDMRMAAAASPAYFADREKPRTPHDLGHHNCINLRFPTYGNLYAWEFEKDGRALNVRVDGQMTVNDTTLALQAAMAGVGISYITEDQVLPLVADGRLVRVLDDWCPPFPGYHLYYPSRRQHSSAFAVIIEALRYRA